MIYTVKNLLTQKCEHSTSTTNSVCIDYFFCQLIQRVAHPFECPKCVQRSLFYDYWHYLLPFGFGNAVNIAFKGCNLLITLWMNCNSVCRAALYFCLGLLIDCGFQIIDLTVFRIDCITIGCDVIHLTWDMMVEITRHEFGPVH